MADDGNHYDHLFKVIIIRLVLSLALALVLCLLASENTIAEARRLAFLTPQVLLAGDSGVGKSSVPLPCYFRRPLRFFCSPHLFGGRYRNCMYIQFRGL
jgi:hypothetical protein